MLLILGLGLGLNGCSHKPSEQVTSLSTEDQVISKPPQQELSQQEPLQQFVSQAEKGTPEWIVEQYLYHPDFPEELGKHFGVRLELLKKQASLGMVRAQDTSLQLEYSRYYIDPRKQAYQITFSSNHQKLHAYWLFDKVDDLWIWSDLIQETPYFPWMKIQRDFQLDSAFVNTQANSNPFIHKDYEGAELYQVIRRGMGGLIDLHHYVDAKRVSFLEISQALLERKEYSAFLHTDQHTNPVRYEKWKGTGLYQWMESEKIERVQIEGLGMILFFYASQPSVEQGVIWCQDFEACLNLQPHLSGYYLIHYQNDLMDPQLKWVHFRGPRSN